MVPLRRLHRPSGDDPEASRRHFESAGLATMRNGSERVRAAQSIQAEGIEEVLH